MKVWLVTPVMLLAACSSAPQVTLQSPVTVAPAASTPAPPSDPLAGLAAFAIADLQAASADAHAQSPPDQTAYQCYDYLIAAIPQLKLPGSGTVGAFVAFQKARDILNGSVNPKGMLTSLNLACAPLTISVQNTVNKLILMGAGATATGGALGPALGGIGAVLP